MNYGRPSCIFSLFCTHTKERLTTLFKPRVTPPPRYRYQILHFSLMSFLVLQLQKYTNIFYFQTISKKNLQKTNNLFLPSVISPQSPQSNRCHFTKTSLANFNRSCFVPVLRNSTIAFAFSPVPSSFVTVPIPNRWCSTVAPI